MSSIPSKADFRTAALARRDALTASDRAAAAQAIAARGWPIEIKRGVVVAGYSPIRNELDPIPLMQALAAKGAQLVNPRAAACHFHLLGQLLRVARTANSRKSSSDSRSSRDGLNCLRQLT